MVLRLFFYIRGGVLNVRWFGGGFVFAGMRVSGFLSPKGRCPFRSFGTRPTLLEQFGIQRVFTYMKPNRKKTLSHKEWRIQRALGSMKYPFLRKIATDRAYNKNSRQLAIDELRKFVAPIKGLLAKLDEIERSL